ncbi:unannotated protein [freshwater metagenome]|uniref:Unannotated protein n=1 Tax=freshwater metagenome TaxID=449393 RepID=A0A6J7MF86_9ZZZZ
MAPHGNGGGAVVAGETEHNKSSERSNDGGVAVWAIADFKRYGSVGDGQLDAGGVSFKAGG